MPDAWSGFGDEFDLNAVAKAFDTLDNESNNELVFKVYIELCKAEVTEEWY